MKNNVEVEIAGQKYNIKGEESNEYLIRITEFVDGKIQEINNRYADMNPVKAAILAAINIADELHKLKDDYESATEKIESRADELNNIMK